MIAISKDDIKSVAVFSGKGRKYWTIVVSLNFESRIEEGKDMTLHTYTAVGDYDFIEWLFPGIEIEWLK